MADSTTPHYNLTLPTVGGDQDTWGDLLNADLTTIDSTMFAIQGAIQPYVANRTIYGNGASFVGSITNTQLTITSVNSGVPAVGQTLYGADVAGGTTIIEAVSVDATGVGTWTVSQNHSVPSEAIASASATQFAPGIETTLTLDVEYLSAPGTLVLFDGVMQPDLTVSGSSLSIPNGVPVGVTTVTVVGATSSTGSDGSDPASFGLSFAVWFQQLPTVPGSSGSFWNNGGTLSQA